MTTLLQQTMVIDPATNLMAHLHTGACNPATQTYFDAQLQNISTKIQAGDLSPLEAILVGQITCLNQMFSNFMLSADAIRQEGKHIDEAERYCKMALSCQTKTVQAIKQLSAMKKPKRGSVYIRTMNQQINTAS